MLINLENTVREKAQLIGASELIMPKFPLDRFHLIDGRSNVIINGKSLAYIFLERGKITIDRVTENVEEFLFWIFEPVTYELALNYAASICQDANQRIYAFTKQIELMEKIEIKKEFIVRLKKEYNRLLDYDLFIL